MQVHAYMLLVWCVYVSWQKCQAFREFFEDWNLLLWKIIQYVFLIVPQKYFYILYMLNLFHIYHRISRVSDT